MEEESSSLTDIEDIFSETEAEKIRASLLWWYSQNRRDLPWRLAEADTEVRAYRVWVSEVMLQQTRVQTVVDYFNRWLSKWPTLKHLSHASLDEVNEMWAGLGYYRRARFLLEGAKTIVEEGRFPENVSSLLKVRGIGDYTAGAIASIAFKEVAPVVDGNVIRVISRLKAISANPKVSSTVKRIWKLAAQLVDPSEPGEFNQSLMELGATICTPLSPKCSHCPISDHCRAFSIARDDSSVLVTNFPSKAPKTKQRSDFSAVCVLEIVKNEDENCGEFLLVKRPEEGLLAGLWEFPSARLEGVFDSESRKEAMDRHLIEQFGLDTTKNKSRVLLREQVGEFVHVFSHIRLKIYAELFVLHIKGGLKSVVKNVDKEALTWKCVDAKAISSMGLTSSVRKVYAMAQKFKQQNMGSNLVQCRKRKGRGV